MIKRGKSVQSLREMAYIPNDLRAIVRMYPEMGDLCLLLPWIRRHCTHPFIRALSAASMAVMPRRPTDLACPV